MREVFLESISPEAFLPYGQVLSEPSAIGSSNGRSTATSHIELIRTEGPSGRDHHLVPLMERHRFSTQTFVPLGGVPYLVIVAPDHRGGGPDLLALRAFRVPGDTVVQYRTGVWHTPLTALEPFGIFAMHIHKDGSDEDCDFLDVPPFKVLVGRGPQRTNAASING